MRLDKFLKNARIIKRRTVAKEACDGGRVMVNGKTAKPGTELACGDIIHIAFGNSTLTAKVLSLKENVRKDDAESLYETLETDKN